MALSFPGPFVPLLWWLAEEETPADKCVHRVKGWVIYDRPLVRY